MPGSTRVTSFSTRFDQTQSPSSHRSSPLPHRTPSNVIIAFRELQNKAKQLENERASAIRLREEMRDQIEADRRARNLWRNQSEMESTEILLNMKSASQQMRQEIDVLESKLASLEEAHRSLQRSLSTKSGHIETLENDVDTVKARIVAAQQKKSLLSFDADVIVDRCTDISQRASSSPSSNRKNRRIARDALDNLREQIEMAYDASNKSKLRARALQRYVEMMTSINEDLCNTLATREEAKGKIIEFAVRFCPPRYAWPKDLQYSDLLKIITDASKATNRDDAFTRAAAATVAAIKTSPMRRRAQAEAGGVSRKASGARPRSAPSSRRKGEFIFPSSHKSMSATMDDLRFARSGGNGEDSWRDASVNETVTEAESLANKASRIASETVDTVEPTIDNIPSYHLFRKTAKRAKPRVKSRSLSPSRKSADLSEHAFIPSSGKVGSSEFNSVANSSIANRALKQLSASISSR